MAASRVLPAGAEAKRKARHSRQRYRNYEAMQFLIDRGIDMTTLDYRWNATAEGWARHAAKDDRLAEFLANAARRR